MVNVFMPTKASAGFVPEASPAPLTATLGALVELSADAEPLWPEDWVAELATVSEDWQPVRPQVAIAMNPVIRNEVVVFMTFSKYHSFFRIQNVDDF
jgi:hypothetical protein